MRLSTLGSIAFEEGNTDQAIELLEQSVEVAAEAGLRLVAGRAASRPRRVRRRGRSLGGCRALDSRDGLAVLLPLRDRQLLVYGLAMLAALEAERGNAERAGQLWGAVEAEEQRGAIGHWESEREQYERIGSRARRRRARSGPRGRPAALAGGCRRASRSPRTELAAIVASLTPRAARRCNPSRRLAADESEEGSNWIRTAETTSRTCHHRASGRSGSPSASPVSS